jgi:hypothetical protein
MFSTYSPVVYGDGGLITITACVCTVLYIRKFKLSDVGNPAKYRARSFCHPLIDFCYFGVCGCVCVCGGGEREKEREK